MDSGRLKSNTIKILIRQGLFLFQWSWVT